MKPDNYTKEVARWVALAALFLVPITPLIVSGSFFFPFITGKAFFFRILVEIAGGAWIVLACLDRAYRPRLSWVGMAVIAFIAWMGIADMFAVNAAKAFWSNFERMEGWVLLAHLLVLFFAMSAILRAEKKWRAWFLTSLGVAIVVSGYAFLQISGMSAIHQGSVRIDASFGNSAYLAIYLFFNVCIAAWLALTERYQMLKWALALFAVIEGVLVFFTETRGTVIALGVALALAAFLAAITAGKHVRRVAVAGLMLLVVLIGGFYLARDSAFVQQNNVLQRIASISLADGATRFTIWHMAFEGVVARPITGWGQEGFNYVFNTYYDPTLYNQEPWFDRAHNAFIDWLTAGGIPGFLLYLALFGSALALLWKSSELSRAERIILTAALVGYGIHNLFVFDNLYSYIYFFAILALIDSPIARPIDRLEHLPLLSGAPAAYALPAATVVVLALIWSVNVPGMRVASNLIVALSPSASGVSANIASFESLAAHPSFAAQEVREQIISFASSVIQNDSVATVDKEKILTLAITEMQKQIAAYPLDAREHLQLAYAYSAAGDAAKALAEIKIAETLSPEKESILLQEGQIALNSGDAPAAHEAFTKAYRLAPQFQDLAAYAAAGDIMIGDAAAADAILLTAYGTTTIDSSILSVAYYRSKNWQRLIDLWKSRINQSNATAQTWFGLAAAYYAAGDNAMAIQTIHAAVARYPDAAASGSAAIAQIQGKKAQ